MAYEIPARSKKKGEWYEKGHSNDYGSGNDVESTRFWTNNPGNIQMEAVKEGTAVKITSTAVSSDGGGRANFKLNGITCTVGDDWKLVCGVGAPSVATPASDVTSSKPFGAVIFQNGLYTEEFEIADLCVINLSKAASSGENPGNDGGDNGGDEEPETPVVDAEAEKKIEDALALVETGYAALLSDENWTTIGSTKGDITWTTTGSSFTGKLNVTEETVTGQTFTKALNIETTAAATAINDVQLCFRLDGKADTEDGTAPIQTGDEIFYAFRIEGNLADSTKILMRPNPNNFNSDTDVRTALGNPTLTNVDGLQTFMLSIRLVEATQKLTQMSFLLPMKRYRRRLKMARQRWLLIPIFPMKVLTR